MPSVGGVVTVHGRNFPRADALACRFGLNARAVRAVWLNESLIECEAPPADMLRRKPQPGSATPGAAAAADAAKAKGDKGAPGCKPMPAPRAS